MAHGLVFLGVVRPDRHQPPDVRLLGHCVQEYIPRDMDGIELAGLVGIQHDPDKADQVLDMGLIPEVGRLSQDLAAEAFEEAEPLVADGGERSLDAGLLLFFDLADYLPEQVAVQASAQTTIGRDDDVTDAFDLALGRQVTVPVFRRRMAQVRDHLQHLFGEGTGGGHPFLRLAHLGRRHHFHGLGDLLRALDAGDLGAYFFRAGHVFSSWLSAAGIEIDANR